MQVRHLVNFGGSFHEAGVLQRLLVHGAPQRSVLSVVAEHNLSSRDAETRRLHKSVCAGWQVLTRSDLVKPELEKVVHHWKVLLDALHQSSDPPGAPSWRQAPIRYWPPALIHYPLLHVMIFSLLAGGPAHSNPISKPTMLLIFVERSMHVVSVRAATRRRLRPNRHRFSFRLHPRRVPTNRVVSTRTVLTSQVRFSLLPDWHLALRFEWNQRREPPAVAASR